MWLFGIWFCLRKVFFWDKNLFFVTIFDTLKVCNCHILRILLCFQWILEQYRKTPLLHPEVSKIKFLVNVNTSLHFFLYQKLKKKFKEIFSQMNSKGERRGKKTSWIMNKKHKNEIKRILAKIFSSSIESSFREVSKCSLGIYFVALIIYSTLCFNSSHKPLLRCDERCFMWCICTLSYLFCSYILSTYFYVFLAIIDSGIFEFYFCS